MLCNSAYMLLTWRPKDAERAEGDAGREAAQWSVLRARLQLAEAGRWSDLVEQAGAAAKEALDSCKGAHMTGAPCADEAGETFRRRTSAAKKVLHD